MLQPTEAASRSNDTHTLHAHSTRMCHTHTIFRHIKKFQKAMRQNVSVSCHIPPPLVCDIPFVTLPSWNTMSWRVSVLIVSIFSRHFCQCHGRWSAPLSRGLFCFFVGYSCHTYMYVYMCIFIRHLCHERGSAPPLSPKVKINCHQRPRCVCTWVCVCVCVWWCVRECVWCIYKAPLSRTEKCTSVTNGEVHHFQEDSSAVLSSLRFVCVCSQGRCCLCSALVYVYKCIFTYISIRIYIYIYIYMCIYIYIHMYTCIFICMYV